MRGDNLTRPTVSDLLEREQNRGNRGAVIAPNENPLNRTSASAAAAAGARMMS
jgi:hypothetical protein